MSTASPEPLPTSWTLRSLIALLGLAGIQLSLIRWVGLLPGLAIPSVACMLILTGVVLTAFFKALKERGPMNLAPWETWLQRLSLMVALYVAAIFLAGAGDVLWRQGSLLYQRHQIQRQLGFRYRHEPHVWQASYRSFPVVTHIEAGGCFDEAGISTDDVILVDHSPAQFIDWLRKRQTDDFEVVIVPASRHQDLTGRPRRTLTVHIRRP
jgi:hypothetical protein